MLEESNAFQWHAFDNIIFTAIFNTSFTIIMFKYIFNVDGFQLCRRALQMKSITHMVVTSPSPLLFLPKLIFTLLLVP